MNHLLAKLRRRLLGISPAETTFARRGFRASVPGAQQHLEAIGRTFVDGYHAALENPAPEELVLRLNAVPVGARGFAFEGAAMGLALLDRLTPWNRGRITQFLEGAGGAHCYMVYVGLGWMLARLGGPIEPVLAKLDPLLGWLALDGLGFHEGFFHWQDYREGQPAPRRVQGYARRAFDLGLGRCLWFIEGCDTEVIPRTIAGFPQERQSDLWSGIGLAATYAGEAEPDRLRGLLAAAGPFHAHLAQGSAFAAKARQRAGNLTPYTDRACRILCGMSPNDAAQITDDALENLPNHRAEPGFEIWRGRIQQRFLHATRSTS